MSTVQLNASIQERIRGLVAQQQALQVRVSEILATALEAQGIVEPVINYNVQTGVATLKESIQQASPDGVAEGVPELVK